MISTMRPMRPPSPRYTAKDILGVNGNPPTYKGGLKAYRRDNVAKGIYTVWHMWATKMKCSHCRGD